MSKKEFEFNSRPLFKSVLDAHDRLSNFTQKLDDATEDLGLLQQMLQDYGICFEVQYQGVAWKRDKNRLGRPWSLFLFTSESTWSPALEAKGLTRVQAAPTLPGFVEHLASLIPVPEEKKSR